MYSHRTNRRWLPFLLGLLALIGGMTLTTASASAGTTAPRADSAVALHEPSVIATRIITQDSFEGRFPNAHWHSSGGWGKSNCLAKTGTYSAWGSGDLGLACDDLYRPYAHDWLVYGPFSLSDAKEADLDLALWLNAEYGYDYIAVAASVDGENFYGDAYTGGSSSPNMAKRAAAFNLAAPRPEQTERQAPRGWSELQSPAGVSTGWADINFDLNNVYQLGNLSGQPSVWIGFYWYTDNYIEYQGGAFVDDVVLSKTVDVQKPARPKLTSPENGSTLGSRRPTLDWAPTAGALTYNLLVRKGSKDGEQVYDESGLTKHELQTMKLAKGTVYYWRVQACNEAGCGKKTKWWSFSTPD